MIKLNVIAIFSRGAFTVQAKYYLGFLLSP